MSRRIVRLKIGPGQKITVRKYTQQVIQVLDVAFERTLPLAGAELGTASGVTASALLHWFPLLRLYMVDKYKEGELRQSMIRLMIEAKQATEFARERRVMIIGHSLDVVKMIPDGSLDFVFVDANHYYVHVLRDLRAWDRKVRSGGVFLGHDYDGRHEQLLNKWGVKQAVDEYAKEQGYTVRTEDHLIWWVLKP